MRLRCMSCVTELVSALLVQSFERLAEYGVEPAAEAKLITSVALPILRGSRSEVTREHEHGKGCPCFHLSPQRGYLSIRVTAPFTIIEAEKAIIQTQPPLWTLGQFLNT